MAEKRARGQYAQIIEHIFHSRYSPGTDQIGFERTDLVKAADEVGVPPPKNLGDLIYSYRFRAALPQSIRCTAAEGLQWIILLAGTARYKFVLTELATIVPRLGMVETKVPDSTPGVIQKYALTDEQALLAKLRYNRLIDIFTGVTCYSLQSHLRTAVEEIGQVETDELYVGVDRMGVHYIIPVQAKGGHDKLSIVQIDQDYALCAAKFRDLVCRPIAAQFVKGGVIALFELQRTDEGFGILAEKHYRLVPPDELSPDDLALYRGESSSA